MKKKRFPLLVIVGSIICFTILVSSHAQEPSKQTLAVPLFKTIKKDGWEIPRIEEKELISRSTINLQDMPVSMKGYKLQKGIDTKLIFYSLNTNDNTLNIYDQSIEIKSVAVYTLNEKVFAYQTLGTPFSTFENGNRENAGILIRVFYLDEDGDGKFESRYIANKLPDKIPLWVTKPTNTYGGSLDKPRN